MEAKTHPIAKIIDKYREIYLKQYNFLLMSNETCFLRECTRSQITYDDDGELSITDVKPPKNLVENNLNIIQKEIKSFIANIVKQIMKFYQITLNK